MELKKPNKLQILSYGFPSIVILASIYIALSPLLKKHPELAMGITFDLTLLSPLIFLIFSNKTDIPKIRIVPIFIIGVAVASYILPTNGQYHLDLIKAYIVPAVEIGVLTFISMKVFKALKSFRLEKNHSDDLFMIIKKSTLFLLGKSRFTQFLASEIAIFYYALFVWKSKKIHWKIFTNYKDNGGLAMISAFLAIVIIETFALHLLIMQWNTLAAWTLTILSVYTAIVILGHLKALILRPSLLTDQELILKNGIVADIKIDLREIKKVEFCSSEISLDNLIVANLGLSKESRNHNTAIYFKKTQTIDKAYGFTSTCDVLLFRIDDKDEFLDKLNTRILELKD